MKKIMLLGLFATAIGLLTPGCKTSNSLTGMDGNSLSILADCPAVYCKKSTIVERDGKIYAAWGCSFEAGCVLVGNSSYFEKNGLQKPQDMGKCSSGETILKYIKK
jgi:hypothetical protein